jgi:hypothetical protein
VPKTVTKKVCVSTKPSGYGHVDAGYSEHHGYSHNVFTFVEPPGGGGSNTTAVANNYFNNSTIQVPYIDR